MHGAGGAKDSPFIPLPPPLSARLVSCFQFQFPPRVSRGRPTTKLSCASLEDDPNPNSSKVSTRRARGLPADRPRWWGVVGLAASAPLMKSTPPMNGAAGLSRGIAHGVHSPTYWIPRSLAHGSLRFKQNRAERVRPLLALSPPASPPLPLEWGRALEEMKRKKGKN